jgi:membrane fusion protein
MHSERTQTTLFREEVFEAKKDTWLGQIVLIRPISFAWLTAAVLILATAVVVFLFLGEYTRKAKVIGYVVPSQGLLKIAAQQTGIVTKLNVIEGQAVKKGDVLAVLSSEHLNATGSLEGAMAAQFGSRRALILQSRSNLISLYEQQRLAMSERIGSIRDELAQADAGIRLQQERLRITEQIIERNRQLLQEKFISELDFRQKEQGWLADLATIENLRRSRTSLARDLQSLIADQRSMPVKHQAELADVEKNLSVNQQGEIENEARREWVLTATEAGTITAITTDKGKLVGAGQPLMSIIPASANMLVEVYVPSRAAGFIHTDARALLQYQAFPYQKFGSHAAKVIRISRTAVQANELPFPAQQNELYYIAKLEPEKQTVTAYGKQQRLQSGMIVDANILLDRRTLIEWVFEPLYSISGNWRK